MKTMTCKDMGGVCDAKITGNTADEMMNNGKDHVHSQDDEGHKNVVKQMEEMQKDQEANKKWNDDFKVKFDALAED